MKKGLTILATMVISLGLLVGCGNDKKEETKTPETTVSNESETVIETEAKETVIPKVAALKGPTTMGMVQMMDEYKDRYDFTVVAAIDEITAKLVKGDVDIAAVPANLASVLYNNTDGQVQVMAINTLGVLYVVENGESIQSIDDLRGKTIYATGKGATPEYVINYVLEQNGLEVGKDVFVEFKSEAAECISAIAGEENGIAMLPQPFVTTAQAKNDQLRVALDLTKEWDDLQTGTEKSALITGVVVVRKEFAEANKEVVNAYLDQYQASVEYVNTNVEEAATLIEGFDIVPAAVAKKAVPFCNITFIEGSEMQEKLNGYLNVLFEQKPESVGGKMPNEDFYYTR